MTPLRILLFYKQSVYDVYFLKNKSVFSPARSLPLKKRYENIQSAHAKHYQTIKDLETLLQQESLSYDKRRRGRKIDFKHYDIILTLGGDGTFLEACRKTVKALVVGINSAPQNSVGKLCVGHPGNLTEIVARIKRGKYKTQKRHRLRILSSTGRVLMDFSNDILLAHSNPAALSRYLLTVRGQTEEQRSSGLWVSTASGSSGAIHSAGAAVLSPGSKNFQYKPRELCRGGGLKQYRLKGGRLGPRESIKIASLMRRGILFIDGAHVQLEFPYGETIKIIHSPDPVQTLSLSSSA